MTVDVLAVHEAVPEPLKKTEILFSWHWRGQKESSTNKKHYPSLFIQEWSQGSRFQVVGRGCFRWTVIRVLQGLRGFVGELLLVLTHVGGCYSLASAELEAIMIPRLKVDRAWESAKQTQPFA